MADDPLFTAHEPSAHPSEEELPSEVSRIVVATYNVHRCLGADGRHDPERVASVLEQIGADVVGLQEVSTRRGAPADVDQLDVLVGASGMHGVAGPTRTAKRGHCGNALLSRWPVREVRQIDLSVAGREQRGAIDAEIDVRGKRVRIIVTHLGLRRRERFDQIARLLEAIQQGAMVPRLPTIILADANDWLPLARVGGQLVTGFAYRRVPTFPARLPVLPLDLVLVNPPEALGAVTAHRTALSRAASDHLPAKAVIHLYPHASVHR
jgi:endonuclease/exonuclease/phosphatase family metal-dependent hydrolase